MQARQILMDKHEETGEGVHEKYLAPAEILEKEGRK